MNRRQKEDAVKALDTNVIKNILGSLQSPENKPPSPEFPMGGLVQLSGIGNVTVVALRAELETRSDK